MNCQMIFNFVGLILSFLGSFFIAIVLAKVFRFRKEGLKDSTDEAKKDLLYLEMNRTSRVARYSTQFAIIGIILLYLGFVFQSIALISCSVVGLSLILGCGVIALAFFILDDL